MNMPQAKPIACCISSSVPRQGEKARSVCGWAGVQVDAFGWLQLVKNEGPGGVGRSPYLHQEDE